MSTEKKIKTTKVKDYRGIVFMVLLFISGTLFGYFFGVTSKFQQSCQESQNAKNSINTYTEEDSENGESITITGIDGYITKIDETTIKVKPLYDNPDAEYTVKITDNTAIKKLNENFDPTANDLFVQISISDLKEDNVVYIESSEDLIDKKEFTASYIEVVLEKNNF